MRTSFFTALVMVVITMQLLARQAEAGVTFVLGGVDGPGWTNKGNIDYNAYMSSFKVKIGDTLGKSAVRWHSLVGIYCLLKLPSAHSDMTYSILACRVLQPRHH